MFNIMLHRTKYYHSTPLQCSHVFLICLLILVTGCGTAPPATPVISFPGSPQCILSPNQPLSVSANIAGATDELEYKWTASAGMFTTPEQTTPAPSASGPIVTYFAPANPMSVIIRVSVSNAKGTSTGELTCSVEATPTPMPTSTETPLPTSTPSPTPTPLPVACNHPSVTGYVFLQLKDVGGQFPFYSDKVPDVFLCHGVYDRYRSGPLSVRIQYTSAEAAGYWGIATPGENGYDAGLDKFTQVCFWAYAEQADQAFYLKIKDKQRRERQAEPPINITEPNKWVEICTPLSRFSDQGVNLSQIENINLGFSESTGSATVWVDDFEFK